MPSPSSVEKLPFAIKDWLDRTLVENNFSGYKLLEEELRERGFQISKSAIHRYGQDFEKRLQNLKMASEQAKAIVAAAPDDEGSVNEALMRLVQEKIFAVLVDFEPDPDKPLNLGSLAKAVAELGRASVTQKKYAAEVKKKAEVAVESIRKKNIPEETLQEIEEAIYGIVR